MQLQSGKQMMQDTYSLPWNR